MLICQNKLIRLPYQQLASTVSDFRLLWSHIVEINLCFNTFFSQVFKFSSDFSYITFCCSIVGALVFSLNFRVVFFKAEFHDFENIGVISQIQLIY